jgi:hypothetical protein
MEAPISRELVEALISDCESKPDKVRYIGQGEHRIALVRNCHPIWKGMLKKLPRTGDSRVIRKLVLFPKTLPAADGSKKTLFLSIRKVKQVCAKVWIQPSPPHADWEDREWA